MALRRDNIAAGSQFGGILLLVTGLTFAALAGAGMKALADELPIALIVWCRFAGFSLLLLPIAAHSIGNAFVNPSPLWMQLLRGCLLPLSTAFYNELVVAAVYARGDASADQAADHGLSRTSAIIYDVLMQDELYRSDET